MSRVVVIGAGPNGLTAAAMLRKSGHDVTLVDKRGPGGRFGGQIPVLHDTSLVSPAICGELGLSLSWQDAPVPTAPDGTALAPPAAWTEFIRTWRPLVQGLCGEPVPDIGDDAPLWPLAKKALSLRKPGSANMMELLRLAPQNLDDMLGEFFEDAQQKALMMLPALIGSWMGPISPTSAANLLLVETLRGQEPVGGHEALVSALSEKAGTVTVAEVTSIRVEKGAVVGVDTDQGPIDADAVVSCIGPVTTLTRLVHPRHLPDHLHRDIGDVRGRGTVAKLHLKTSSPLFPHTLVRTAAQPLDIERAYDDAKHRRLPRHPALEVRQLEHGVSVLVFGCARDLDGGWTDEAGAALQATVLDQLERLVPGTRDAIDEATLLSPADLESGWGLDQGNPFQVELAVDQLYVMRPLPRLARGDTGIRGLTLGSDGQHPGVGPTLVPGWLAAQRAT